MVEDARLRRLLEKGVGKAGKAFDLVAGQPIEIGEDVVADRPGALKEKLLIGQRGKNAPQVAARVGKKAGDRRRETLFAGR